MNHKASSQRYAMELVKPYLNLTKLWNWNLAVF